MTSLHTVLCHIAGMGHCLTGRENCFQQSDRLAGLVGEELHPHSIGLKGCPELHVKLCKKQNHYITVLYKAWAGLLFLALVY